MIVYPAIDLLDGACVRLYQGDYDAVTRFSDDPLQVAGAFAAQGAQALHVVDLEGARSGAPAHAELVMGIAAECGLPIQVGGGIRTPEQAASYLDGGVHRVLIGTAAVSDPGWLSDAVQRYGADRVAVALDVRDGEVVTEGWLSESGRTADSVTASLRALGVETLLYTDTRRDGTLTSVDSEGSRRLVEAGFQVIAAGGISSTADIRALRRVGAAGAVVGSALYRGRMTLPEAMEAAC
jgi:phosphoribosylformimino-5-aminoimidazole carboxamide ribotide isomerase